MGLFRRGREWLALQEPRANELPLPEPVLLRDDPETVWGGVEFADQLAGTPDVIEEAADLAGPILSMLHNWEGVDLTPLWAEAAVVHGVRFGVALAVLDRRLKAKEGRTQRYTFTVMALAPTRFRNLPTHLHDRYVLAVRIAHYSARTGIEPGRVTLNAIGSTPPNPW